MNDLLVLLAGSLWRSFFIPLKVTSTFPARKTAPHSLCGFVETRIIKLTSEIADPPAFFAHDWVCRISTLFAWLNHRSAAGLLFWHFDYLLNKAVSFEGGFSSHPQLAPSLKRKDSHLHQPNTFGPASDACLKGRIGNFSKTAGTDDHP